jgi:hypothetical protein
VSISTAIYSRLNDTTITSIVGSRIYPTEPNQGTDFPFIVYRVTKSNPVTSMAGLSGMTTYTIQVDVWSKSVSSSDSLTNAIAARLHCYRGGNITGSFLSDQSNEQLSDDTEGDIYHASQLFTVWATTATVTATPDATGKIQTGNNSVSLTACNHQLNLDCGGLTLDGTAVIPDLTPYARKDTANTFIADQTIVTPNATTLPLTIKGATGQTADLMQIQNGSASPITRFENNGSMTVRGAEGGTWRLGFIGNTYGVFTGIASDGASGLTLSSQVGITTSFGNTSSVYTINAPQKINNYNSNNAVPVLAVKGGAGQSANLTEWKDSGSNNLMALSANGGLKIIPTTSTNTVGLYIKPASVNSPNAITVERRDSTSTVFSVDGTGLTFVNGLGVNAAANTNQSVIISTIGASTRKGLVIQGESGQSANLTEWQDSAGTVLAKVTNDGSVTSNSLVFGASLRVGNSTGQIDLSGSTLVFAATSIRIGAALTIKNTGTFRNAADTADAPISASTVTASTSITTPSIRLPATTAAPSNTTTPTGWTDLVVNGTTYKTPLYL